MKYLWYGRCKQHVINFTHESSEKAYLNILLASVSKTFTGFALAALVDKGILSLEDKVSKWVPEVASNPWVGDISLIDFATHSSGLSYYPGEYNSNDVNGLHPLDPLNPSSLEGAISKAKSELRIFANSFYV